MKMMTCRQIGGPCDEPIYGNTPEEMMQNGEKHILEMGDEGHKAAAKMMSDTAANPEASKKWLEDFMKIYDRLE